MSSCIKDLGGKLAERRHRLAKLFEDNQQADGRYNFTAEQREEVKSLNDELTDLGKQYDTARQDEELASANRAALKSLSEPRDPIPFSGRPLQGEEAERHVKSLGQRFIESPSFKAFRPGSPGGVIVEFEGMTLDQAVKTTMTTAAGFTAPNNRGPVTVPYAVRRPVVADLIPSDPTTASTIKYMEETTFTNSAASVAENAQKPESAFAWTERSQTVEVIATTLPVTKQQMEDVPGIRGVIDNRLTLQLQLTEEVELLTGTGSTPHLQGFLTKSGIQTQAKSTDATPTAIYKAMTLIRHTGFAEPTGLVSHPNDWQDVVTLQDANGNYIWGKPSDEGPERIWGLPVIVTTAETQNTMLLGDFRMYSHISRRQGIQIDVGYVNDDFRYNRMTIRAEERMSLEIYRAAAFCTVTGV